MPPTSRRPVVSPQSRHPVQASATGAAATDKPKAPAAPPFQITPVRPVGERLLNFMVYGPYGHGKTTFAASADDVPSMRDVLFINAESGDMSLTGRRTLDIININKYTQLARIFEYLTLHCQWRDEGNTAKLLEYERQLKATVIPEDQQTQPSTPGRTWFEEQRLRTGKPMDEPYLYRTVILDSISELHKYLVYKYTGVVIGTTKLDQEVERMEEWQPAQELFRLLIRSFRDLPMNVGFVSAEVIQDPDRKKGEKHAKALPKLAGQMAGDIAGFIDIVGYLVREIGKDGETTRKLYLGAGYEDFLSKHRFENLPDLDYVEDPTLASLIDLARKDAQYNGTRDSSSRPEGRPVPSGSGTAAPQRSGNPGASRQPRSGGGRNAVRRSR